MEMQEKFRQVVRIAQLLPILACWLWLAPPQSLAQTGKGAKNPSGEAEARKIGPNWSADFRRLDATLSIRAEGKAVADGVQHTFESFSPLLLSPSATGEFRVERLSLIASGAQHVVFQDSQPGLALNPGGDPFYKRLEGAISSLFYVPDRSFDNVQVKGFVNTRNNPKGSQSRQGLLARWDFGNNFYWFNVDYATGEFEVVRSRYFGVIETLRHQPIKGFVNTKPYFLEFELVGPDLRGKVYEAVAKGEELVPGTQVADSDWVNDRDPHLFGVSGFLAELSMQAPFVPLEGSFAQLASAAIPGDELRIKSPLYEQARELHRRGDLRGAAAKYSEALAANPDLIPAMRDLAWLRATSKESELRDPEQAVQLAEDALEGIIKAFNTRDRSAPPLYSRLDIIKAGYTLAAAYAAAGRFAAPAANELQRILVPSGVSREQALLAASGSGAAVAISYAQWALEVATGEHLRQPTAETEALVRLGEQLLANFRQETAISGEPLPGTVR